ncbi:hypothetical protein KIN20_006411 [Parelaphostrongylus tenuis]|uniref:Uncharacterized protein n=1 Tax=Parelaphostrongylus tenuis TaxID=148309 RepID=A0AAD5MKB6_PARTN|nr:hypothetical protein KIN20_006411 [Parelaphostrongylus tenuis]
MNKSRVPLGKLVINSVQLLAVKIGVDGFAIRNKFKMQIPLSSAANSRELGDGSFSKPEIKSSHRVWLVVRISVRWLTPHFRP